MHRRRFLARLAAASAAPGLAVPLARAAAASPDPGLIDTNVYLSSWPIRDTWVQSPDMLVARLRRHGVIEAWTGSFEGVLHTDLAAVNARLAETCARAGGGILRPFGTINPTFPDWEEDVRRCDEVHRMRGVRVFPSYHGYGLDDPRFARLLDLARQRGLLVQIVVSIEDDRSQNPALTAAPVQPGPLADLLPKLPARVMLLNAAARALTASTPLLQRLIAARVLFDLATLEGVAGIAGVLQRAPALPLAFGSHTPYFYFEAALLKLQESELTPEQLTAIRFGHARAALSA